MKGGVCRYSLTRWHQLLQWGQNRDTEMAQLFQIQKYGLKHVTPQEGSGPELRRTTRFHIKIQKRRRHAPRAVAPSTLLPSSEQEPEALAAHSPFIKNNDKKPARTNTGSQPDQPRRTGICKLGNFEKKKTIGCCRQPPLSRPSTEQLIHFEKNTGNPFK